MKKSKLNVFFIPAITLMTSCSQANKQPLSESNKPVADTVQKPSAKSEADSKLETSWAEFVKAVNSSDLKKVKDLSTDYIRCTDCVANTDKEDAAFEKFKEKNPETWNETLLNKLSLIPIDKFINEDYKIVFDQQIKSKLTGAKNITFNDNEHNRQLYHNCQIADGAGIGNPKLKEVIVNIMPAKTSPSSEEDLGWSAAFAFIQIKDGSYKFCGYSTTP